MRKAYLLLEGDNDVILCKRKLGRTEEVVLSELDLDNLAEKLMYAYVREEDIKIRDTYYNNLLIKHTEIKDLIFDIFLFSKYFKELDNYSAYKFELIEKEEKLTLLLINSFEDRLKYIDKIKQSILSPYRKEAFDIKAVDMNIWANLEMSFRKLNKQVKEKQ